MAGLAAVGFTALLAMVLQSAVFARLVPFTGVIPNIMLVLVVVLGVRHQGVRGVIAAFSLGYLLDTFVGTMLGLHALAFTLVYAGIVIVSQTLHADRGAGVILTVFVASCVHAIVTLVAVRMAYGAPAMAGATWHVLSEAAATSVVAPAVFAFVDWQQRLLGTGT